MLNMRFVTSESQTFASVEDMFNEISYVKGCIPAAAVKIEDGDFNPYANAFEAIRTADILKNIAHRRVSLAIYSPEITETGTICITTTIYE